MGSPHIPSINESGMDRKVGLTLPAARFRNCRVTTRLQFTVT